jgi:hypothetical protein
MKRFLNLKNKRKLVELSNIIGLSIILSIIIPDNYYFLKIYIYTPDWSLILD